MLKDIGLVLPDLAEEVAERERVGGGPYEVIIIGGGPAGMTAAVYAARKKLQTLLVSGDLGGQMLAIVVARPQRRLALYQRVICAQPRRAGDHRTSTSHRLQHDYRQPFRTRRVDHDIAGSIPPRQLGVWTPAGNKDLLLPTAEAGH